jgi:inosine/guanosine/xanthosine phosphorylase family protein
VGLVLGSGLGALAARVDPVLSVAQSEVPGLPAPTVEGHPGRLVLGTLEGRRLAVLQGRAHAYEGVPFRDLGAGVRLLEALGTRVLVLTNAAGSLRRRYAPGTLLLLADHLNWMAGNPLVGRSPDEVRDPFPDMSAPYDAELRELLREAAIAARVPAAEGVYAGVLGPSYETPAEIAMLRRFGADAVGMSTVPETIAARERGMRVAAVSCLVNLGAGLSPAPLTHDGVLAAAERAGAALETLVRGFLRRLPP